MKILLDTNVLLMAIPKVSPYRPIFDALLAGKYSLVLSEAILQEYTEVIGRKTTAEIAQNLAELLVQLSNVERVEVFFRWELISKDPDDNKFVDCAISSGAEFIVTNDSHFNILEKVDFPPVEVISADEFMEKMNR